MLRLAWAGLRSRAARRLRSPAPPPPAEDPGSAPMRFEWRREGPAERLRLELPRLDFGGRLLDQRYRRASSRRLRKRGTFTGRCWCSIPTAARCWARSRSAAPSAASKWSPPSARPCRCRRLRHGERRAALAPNANCESMCAFLLLAGSRRYVPPQAQVLVHQIWLGKKRKNALEFELFGRGAQHRPARHRAAGAIHRRDGRRGRAARNGIADTALGAALSRSPPKRSQRMRLNTVAMRCSIAIAADHNIGRAGGPPHRWRRSGHPAPSRD